MKFSLKKILSDRFDDQPLFEIQLTGITVDPADRLLAVGDNKVVRFTPEGEPEQAVELDHLGWSLFAEVNIVWVGMDGRVASCSSSGDLLQTLEDVERLGRVTSLVASDDRLMVADATHRTLRLYSKEGTWLRDVGADVNTRGFMIPNGVLDLSLDASDDTIVVAHPQKHRVERYDWNGELIEKWGRFGMHDPADFGGCCNPTNIAASTEGLIAVSEKAPPRVKLFNRDGSLLWVSEDGIFEPNAKNADLAFDSQGRLYATDPQRKVIAMFELVPDEVLQP